MNENIKGPLEELLIFDIVPGLLVYYSLFSLHFKAFFIMFFLFIIMNSLVLFIICRRVHKKEKTAEFISDLNYLIQKQNLRNMKNGDLYLQLEFPEDRSCR